MTSLSMRKAFLFLGGHDKAQVVKIFGDELFLPLV